MDAKTQAVSDMYAKFPYPSPQGHRREFKELANLLTIFSRETGYTLEGKKVLDAGTGTGHRLVEPAIAFPQTDFIGIDVSEVPLEIAAQAALDARTTNVAFHPFNIMDANKRLGTFDMILSMGVVHHLADPTLGVCNLAEHLADDGILFLYLYGQHGSTERIRRKRIISLLRKERDDFAEGLQTVEDLGYEAPGYGWNLNVTDEASRNALMVDAYMNVHETLFDVDDIVAVMQAAGFYGFMVYGVALERHGRLLETRIKAETNLRLPITEVSVCLTTAALQAKYEALPLIDKYRLIDLLYQPSGYTVLGFTKDAFNRVTTDRIRANTLIMSKLQASAGDELRGVLEDPVT